MGYQLDVVTASVAEAVRHAGGLMFDRSAAGWRVRDVKRDPAELPVWGESRDGGAPTTTVLDRPRAPSLVGGFPRG